MAFNLRLEMNNEKREALKASLNELIGIKNKAFTKLKQNKLHLNLEKADKTKEGNVNINININDNKNTKNSIYNIATPVLSADRILQQNSFRI
jgi:hypothetical protein